MFVLLLLACQRETPEALVVRACEAMPGLDVDAVGRQLLRDALVADELAIYDASPDHRASLLTATLAGYGVIRANSSCQLVSREEDRYSLIRWEPDIDPARFVVEDVVELPYARRELSLELESGPEGPRVRAGVAEALREADAAWAMGEEGDVAGKRAALQDLHSRFPDPLILFEML